MNLSAEVSDRIRAIRFDERLSASVFVEHALRNLFNGISDRELADQLRANGASLRRQNLADGVASDARLANDAIRV